MTRLLRVAGGAVLAFAVIGCGSPPGQTPGVPGDAGVATKQLVINALSGAGIPATDAIKPYRPSETPSLIGAARSVIQAQLANDPDHGFIVIYSFPSAVAAEKAAFDQAAYVASPAGGIQFPPGSHFVIRIMDTAVLFFTWAPGTSPDLGQQRIEDTVSGMGIPVPIPR